MDDKTKLNHVNEDVEMFKLKEEVQSLRQQRFLTVLGIIGTVIAFLVSNTDKILDLLYHKPKIQVATEDEYLQKNAQLTVSRRDKEGIVVVSDSLPNPQKWFSVEPGAYHLTVAAFGETVYERDFTVEKGDSRNFVIPKLQGTNIRVFVENRSGRIKPKSELEFQVEVSGNGYVWVFEKQPKGLMLIYPANCPSNCDNEVSVNRGLHLPDLKGRTIFAGTQAGEERLFFFVTSSNDFNVAKGLANLFEGASITKASSGITKDNWGYAEISYKILER